jgi:hypothetical protein
LTLSTLLADAVKVTLGPKGRNVVLDKSFGAPRITKDGVAVAKEIELADKFENMGAQMVREVANKTSDVAGDGTTTATVLAQAIVREGIKLFAAGMNPMEETAARPRLGCAANFCTKLSLYKRPPQLEEDRAIERAQGQGSLIDGESSRFTLRPDC